MCSFKNVYKKKPNNLKDMKKYCKNFKKKKKGKNQAQSSFILIKFFVKNRYLYFLKKTYSEDYYIKFTSTDTSKDRSCQQLDLFL